MAPPLSWLLLVTLAGSILALSGSVVSEEEREVYIVYMGDLPKGDWISVSSLHTNILQQVLGSRDASKYLLRSYKRSFSGFVAKLTKEEVKRLSGLKGVVSVFPNKKLQLHTTRSWDFLGFPLKAKRNTTESDIIVGVLDSGIWPDSESFNDEGFGPPPSKWKGTCDTSSNFTCNNKLIGAKYYLVDGGVPGTILSPIDEQGHGTHTASTAAGSVVDGASLLGVASGTARGGVPSARIAVYKICWPDDGCNSADILSAFDDAVADGVDIISLSVGSSVPSDYFEDPIAIGAFHSFKNGVLTSNSAGNSGPNASTIGNFSPWSLSVAATTIDRKFLTKFVLGNNDTYQDSISINTVHQESFHPLIYGGDAPNILLGFTKEESRLCVLTSLNTSLVSGKIVICDDASLGEGALLAEAVGSIIPDAGLEGSTSPFLVATSALSASNISKVKEYLNSDSKPTARIERTIAVNEDDSAPIVASFSSRGPSIFTPELLSPDIAAPGVNILAAWSGLTTLTGIPGDDRVVKYNIISGTSMACPHASGVAAYVKSFHPNWSPAAIKSAIITTAKPINDKINTDKEFGYGAGLLNPSKAADPGLVYDAGVADFIKLLCGQGYNTENLRLVTGDESSCTEATNGTVWDLNYPTFTLAISDGQTVTRTFNRTVTNVGSPTSTYEANVTAPSGLTIKVQPNKLTFKSLGEKKTFTLTATATISGNQPTHLSGSLVWDDGVFQVRSPIVAFAL